MIRLALRWASRIAAGGAVLLVAGFVWFAISTQRAGAPPPHADGIVVLTGGADRVETALRLLQTGAGDRLLVSGVARGAALGDIGRHLDFDPASLAARVTLGHAATSTFGNAEEAAVWARANAIGSLIVVTAGYHMPRAMLELGRALPGMTLYRLPVASPAMRTPGLVRLLVVEYVKLLAAWCGLSQQGPGGENPVGKFVSG